MSRERHSLDPAKRVMQRLELLGRISDEPEGLTRSYGSAAMRRANKLVNSWMRDAGMAVREDPIGNLIGRYPAGCDIFPGRAAPEQVFLLGSHLDTVRNAGKYDGALGVIVSISCVEEVRRKRLQLPFAMEVIGFADEEGLRFHQAYLGSRAVAGTLSAEDLKRVDRSQVTLARAIRDFGGNPAALRTAKMDPNRLLGYAEVHIEQGPVLEHQGLAVGVVRAIAGQNRFLVTLRGQAGHAGTTPMQLRRDALCAAAEMVLATEFLARRSRELTATVGEIEALPGVSNVIPGQVRLSIDLRSTHDSVRKEAALQLHQLARKIAARRKIVAKWTKVSHTDAVQLDSKLSGLLVGAAKQYQKQVPLLDSGAGHDAAIMAGITPACMLFVRCKDGISHHPNERIAEQDVRAALQVMNRFLEELAVAYGQTHV